MELNAVSWIDTIMGLYSNRAGALVDSTFVPPTAQQFLGLCMEDVLRWTFVLVCTLTLYRNRFYCKMAMMVLLISAIFLEFSVYHLASTAAILMLMRGAEREMVGEINHLRNDLITIKRELGNVKDRCVIKCRCSKPEEARSPVEEARRDARQGIEERMDTTIRKINARGPFGREHQ